MRTIKLSLILLLVMLTACASAFMKGGSLVDAGFKPKKVLVSYKGEGTLPAGIDYQLVETEKGTAIFERSQDGSGALFETQWQNKDGMHYAGWVAMSHGYEFVIINKKTGIVKKYVYPAGTYSLQTIEGIERPVPNAKVAPVATLTPKK